MISPWLSTYSVADINFEETVSTLRYADRAKNIVNKAVVNEDPTDKVIRMLQEEVVRLRNQLSEIVPDSDLNDRLQVAEKLMEDLNLSWEEKLSKTQTIAQEREKALEEMGIMVNQSRSGGFIGVSSPKRIPHLVNLNEDPLMSECLLYPLKPGITRVGQPLHAEDTEQDSKIFLSGERILPQHCYFENDNGVVQIVPLEGSIVLVNGLVIDGPRKLSSGFRILLGENHLFRFNNPDEVRRDRERIRRKKSFANMHEINDSIPSSLAYSVVSEYETFHGRPEFSDTDSCRRSSLPFLDTDKDSESRRGNSLAYIGTEKENENQLEEFLQGSRVDENPPATLRVKQSTESFAVDPLEMQAQKLKVDEQDLLDDLPIPPSMQESRLTQSLRKVIRKWRSYRQTSLMMAILENTPLLKEANVISKELGKNMEFQFLMYRPGDSVTPAVSFWDSPTQLEKATTEITDDIDETFELSKSNGSAVVVEVFDYNRNIRFIWSMDKFQRRLKEMRKLYNFTDPHQRPLSCNDPFLDGPTIDSPYKKFLFNHLGYSRVMLPAILRNVERSKAEHVHLAVISPNRGAIEGWLHLEFSQITEADVTADQMLLEIHISSLELLDQTARMQIHAQFELSNLGEPSKHGDDSTPSTRSRLFCSEPSETFAGQVKFNYRQILDLKLTKEVRERLAYEPLQVDIFAHEVKSPAPLGDMIRLRNSSLASLSETSSQVHATATAMDSFLDRYFCAGHMKALPTSELSKHDIYANVEICELAPCGSYLPVPVITDSFFSDMDPGMLYLRQGVQRRVVISMYHDSGSTLRMLRVSQVRVSRIRLCERNGKNIFVGQPNPESFDLTLRLYATQKNIRVMKDGRSYQWVEAAWDSSLHESTLLNRVTSANGQSGSRVRVVATLTWYVDIEGCSEPLEFESDVFLQIIARDAKLPSDVSDENGRQGGLFSGIFTSRVRKSIGKVSSVFNASLRSIQRPVSQPVSDEHTVSLKNDTLSRRGKSKLLYGKYVRGEENLGNWKAKGLELLVEDDVLRKRVELLNDVQHAEELLRTKTTLPTVQCVDQQALLARVCKLIMSKSRLHSTRFTSDEEDRSAYYSCKIEYFSPSVKLQKKS